MIYKYTHPILYRVHQLCTDFSRYEIDICTAPRNLFVIWKRINVLISTQKIYIDRRSKIFTDLHNIAQLLRYWHSGVVFRTTKKWDKILMFWWTCPFKHVKMRVTTGSITLYWTLITGIPQSFYLISLIYISGSIMAGLNYGRFY